MTEIREIIGEHKNFVFIGEAGSGKSEISLNFALWLKALADKEVHFFDMDMTKPLFRSRDMEAELAALGIYVRFQEQFMDAPTLVGGVRPALKDPEVYTVLDVGGDYIGARSIGGFTAELNRDDTMVFYVLNAYRPWCGSIEHIDGTLGKILGVSHIALSKLRFVNNTNCGANTTTGELIAVSKRLEDIVGAYARIEFSTVREELFEIVRNRINPVYPIRLFLADFWNE